MKYHTIRKVAWDQRWHALYRTRGGRETYDRIPRRQALLIAKRLDRHH
jgi:hypothetical protein